MNAADIDSARHTPRTAAQEQGDRARDVDPYRDDEEQGPDAAEQPVERARRQPPGPLTAGAGGPR